VIRISGICSLNDSRTSRMTIAGTDLRACDWRANWNATRDPANADFDWNVNEGITKMMRDENERDKNRTRRIR